MDPTAVVGLVASCAKLADIILKTTTTLNALRGRFSTSEIAVTSLVTQLQALEASTSELRSLLQDRGPSVSQSEKLVTSLDACLISATTIIQPLRDQVSEAWSSIDSGKRWGRWGRAKHVMNEASLVPLKEAIRDQVQAMQLLLTVAFLYS